ncbi:disease resistance protein RPS2-like [Macadamia integrifolia]|uniref:disease resistance protein RPS2-like n=1 Tax=Macadamia integrifolia TaxID=60698 RepID=UPI001C53151E|nr:disease resistance protein RPS2-like [Macadamia integrifolia]
MKIELKSARVRREVPPPETSSTQRKSELTNVNCEEVAVVQDLKARRNDEQSSLKASENAGQVETNVASNWFKAVQKIELEADVIKKEYNERTYAGGWCVNCWSLYKLSKWSVDLKLKADYRLSEQFVVARLPSPKPVIETPTDPIIENQQSAQCMLLQMLDCIGDSDPRFGIIGVYGMGGVGKTTLAREVNNHFVKDSCFETVIMVRVSATPNIPSIQTTICKRLGLPDNNDADALYEALKKKKFLLILDDEWCKLKLEDVGIPHPTRSKRGSKILVTSRSKDVCTDMGARKTIKVQPLSEDESCELFVEVAGEHVGADGIKCFAEKLVGRCKGLPLAIVTVGQAMANRHGVGEWANAVREMELSATNLRGMIDEVFIPLKFSFDRLEDNMLRSMFLYCACFPEDHNISQDNILDYCVGEGLLDILGSLTAAKNKGEALIGSLKIACMLEDGEEKDSVRIHDVMRELAFWITSSSVSDSNPKFLIWIGETFKEAPQAHEWVDATRFSLRDTQIRELPELEEKCRKLTTLLLRNNENLTAIPPINFLQHMDNLTVLDLSNSEKLEYLPDSLSGLVNLRVLRLRFCERLRELPTVGMLPQLQVLDLGFCSFELDLQIMGGSMSNLRYLDMEWSGVSIPVGVISRLQKLEELKLCLADKIKWRVSGFGNDEKWDGNHGMDITISDWFKPLANKIKALWLGRCKIEKQDALQAFNESQNLDYLRIEDCSGVTCVPTRVEREVAIQNCEDLEVELDGAEEDSFKWLHLRRLPKLKRIRGSLAPLNCFAQLYGLQIEECNSLKMVFTKGMPHLFNNLNEIIVQKCEKMEVIIEEEEEEAGVISPFPRLNTLWLFNRPALTEVCTNHILYCPLTNWVRVENCEKLKKNPLNIRNGDGLLVIEEEKKSWRKGSKVMEEEIQASSSM